MRIRRRLPLPPISSPLPLPPPPPQIPDPSLFELKPPNKGEETKEKGVGGGGGGEGLHPVGDLAIEPHGWVMDPINWDPSTSASHPSTGRSKQGSKPPFFPPTLSHAKVLKEVREEEEEEEEMVDSNKRWKTQVHSNKRIGSSSSAPVSEESAPGERPLLPKKRRGGGDDNGNGYGRREEKTPKSKARAKVSSRVENDCTTVNGGDNKRADVATVNGSVGSNGKKRRSPAVLMEGSRCSRVNGRGWRCCQQTLVGYSLCEHHLGKGRLRSMSGVRVQAGSSKPKKSTEGGADGAAPLSSSPQEEEKAALDIKQSSGVDHGEMDMEEEEEKQVRKRRKKIGMVKARTISSLLDETNHSVQSTLSSPPISPSPPPPPPEPAPMQPIDEGETIV